MFLRMKRATIGYEGRTSVVYRSEYHDHTNIVSVIGCPRAKQVHWLPDLVLSPLLMGVGLKLNRWMSN